MVGDDYGDGLSLHTCHLGGGDSHHKLLPFFPITTVHSNIKRMTEQLLYRHYTRLKGIGLILKKINIVRSTYII